MNPLASQYIRALESKNLLDPSCKTCNEEFYPLLNEGRKMSQINAPSHKASDACESGKHSHCSCDVCF